MDRQQEITRHVPAGARGIEVAPSHSPILPADAGYDVISLDVFDRETLMARAEADPTLGTAMAQRIGKVDLVGSACEIAELARERYGPDATVDFILSSHNFEHLPDPVRFLQGCETLLAPGGVLSMAVPDKRSCFDYLRPHTTTPDMLEAFHERRIRPTFAQTFSQGAYFVQYRDSTGAGGAFSLGTNPHDIALHGDGIAAYQDWLTRLRAGDTRYHDTHCWTFTPSSLELILTELSLFGLIGLEIMSVSETCGCEFIVHLRKRPADAPVQGNLIARRETLLFQVIDELALASRYAWNLRRKTAVPRDPASVASDSGPPQRPGLDSGLGGA